MKIYCNCPEHYLRSPQGKPSSCYYKYIAGGESLCKKNDKKGCEYASTVKKTIKRYKLGTIK